MNVVCVCTGTWRLDRIHVSCIDWALLLTCPPCITLGWFATVAVVKISLLISMATVKIADPRALPSRVCLPRRSVGT